MGGDHAYVLQLLSKPAIQRRSTVHVSHSGGVRDVHHLLFRLVLPDHREEVDQRIQAKDGGDPSAVLLVLQQHIHRMGLLYQQQDIGNAEAEGRVQRAAVVPGGGPAESGKQEPRKARARGHRPAAGLDAGDRAHRVRVLLGLPDVLLLDQAAAGRADVHVGVPPGVRHARGRHVLQRGAADRVRRAAKVRAPVHVPGDATVHIADNLRARVAAGRAAGLGVPADQLRARAVAVRQRAVQLAAVLGDVRGQDHVQAAGRRRGVQDRHHRADQLPAQHTDPALQEQPVPGDVQAGAEPGQARAGRHLRADDRVAGQLLRDAAARPGPRVAGHHVLHQAVLVHRQLQPCAEGVQPVPHAHHDHVHAAGGLRALLHRVASRHVQDHAVPVLRPVQGAVVRLEGAGRHGAGHAPVGDDRLRDTDQRQLHGTADRHVAVRDLLLPHRDGFQQEDDRGAAQAARARRSRQAVPVEPAERVHQAARQTPQGGGE